MKNVTDALMQALPQFSEPFVAALRDLLGSADRPFRGWMANNVLLSAASNIIRIYDGYISAGKSCKDIRRAFRQVAEQLIDHQG